MTKVPIIKQYSYDTTDVKRISSIYSHKKCSCKKSQSLASKVTGKVKQLTIG
jgi:hypothetical protein